MYKVIFIALLLVLPSVVANSSPYEELYEAGKRASEMLNLEKILKDPRICPRTCEEKCASVSGWMRFVCPKACSIVYDILWPDFDC